MHRTFPVRYTKDDRAFLNLGSDIRVVPDWNNVDFNWIIRLGRYPALCRVLSRSGLLSRSRYDRTQRMDRNTIVWDLRNGIPFPDETFDCVYHSHLLEHIDLNAAPVFLEECFRVLKADGTIRIVVPDLEEITRKYLVCLGSVASGAGDTAEYDASVADIFDQMIVRTPKHRLAEPWVVRWVEDLIVGNTAKNGVLHRWMYDRFSLTRLLGRVGFTDITVRGPSTSRIPGWSSFNLDTEPGGIVYKRNSIYIEAARPVRLRAARRT